MQQNVSHHNKDCTGKTPFLNLFWYLWIKCMSTAAEDVILACRRPELLLNLWLTCLQEAGVDLEEYGRKEMELHEEGLISWVLKDSTTWKGDWILVLKTFTYGPSPSDWEVQLERRDAKADAEPRKTPGAWIEDDESYGEVTDVIIFDGTFKFPGFPVILGGRAEDDQYIYDPRDELDD